MEIVLAMKKVTTESGVRKLTLALSRCCNGGSVGRTGRKVDKVGQLIGTRARYEKPKYLRQLSIRRSFKVVLSRS